MRDELLGYYERELAFLRQLGAEFADKYPKIASRLMLEPERCEDPHVERMIEAVAFLTSRVHRKIDDEFPELTESLLNVLYPNLLAPIPSASIVQFLTDPERSNVQTGQTVPRGARLYAKPVEGFSCRFRTCYPVTVWPIELAGVRFELPAPGSTLSGTTRTVLKLELRTFGSIPFSQLREKTPEEGERPLDHLRFYLQGESKVVHGLYETLLNDLVRVEVRAAGASTGVVLPRGAVRPVGFERDEGLLPYSERSFLGYRLLQEYFAFPEKFLFFDLSRLENAMATQNGDRIEVLFCLSREFQLERSVNAQTFRLNCSPIVNLFEQVAEPIHLSHLQSEYRVIPDVGHQSALEVYSVDAVSSSRPDQEAATFYEPFYSVRHAGDREASPAFWHASRRASHRKDDDGTEVYLTFVDLGFNPSVPQVETITVHATCSNRDLPARLPFGNPEGDFHLEGPGAFTGIRCLRKPTPSLRAPLRRGAQWRLISHLSLNHLSLVEGEGKGGAEALQEILKLHDFADSGANRQQIAGITRLSTQRVLRPVGSAHASFVRGLEVSLEFDDQQFIGSGVFLFASILERFLGLYASINSFSQLVVSTQQREGILKRWAPRAGEQIVL